MSTSSRRCGWKSGGLRGSASLCARPCSSRSGDRPPRRSRRWAVRLASTSAPAGNCGPQPFFIVVERFSVWRAAAARLAGHRNDVLRVRGDRQQPVRRLPPRARARRCLPSRRPRAAAVVRRPRLPVQEAGAARDDVWRHQLARPSAQPLLRAQPPFPRLHALQPHLDAEGSDRVVSGLPDLHHRERAGQRARSALHRRDPRREAAGARRHVAGVRFHRAAAAQADTCLDSGRVRGTRAGLRLPAWIT